MRHRPRIRPNSERDMSIPLEQLDKLAYLAQLAIPATARADVAAQLGGIIAMVEAITAADTRGIEPLANPLDQTMRLRADVVSEGDEREAMQRVAPAAREGFYLVPRVVE
jgi:aspartyl-tRNA(Asn)/glutamyl-tRNA(Gln) amidotransferase subunit C